MTITILFRNGKELSVKCNSVEFERNTTGRITNLDFTGQYADEILMEHFKYLEHCELCGYVHAWELSLSDKFKDQVMAMVRSMK